MSRRLISVVAICMLCLTSHAKWPLPYDAEVEWLLGDGASSIFTGINADISKDVVRCGAIEPVGGLNGTIFCYKSGVNPVNKLHFYDSSSGTHSVRIVFGSYGSTGFYSNYGFAAFGERIDAVINHTNLTVSFTRTSDGYNISGNITVRPYVWEEYILFQNTRAEVCSFSVERSGDIMIDLIPVRFTNENGVSEGAMYDKVSGKLFRNQGTGAFIIGPDKTTAEPIVRTGKFERIYSARDYVQDGLVAMWDGIENAGWGVHDSSIRNWPSLVGGHILTAWQASTVSWTDNSPTFNAYMRCAANFDFSGGGTVEQVANFASLQRGYVTMSSAIGLQMFSDDTSNGNYVFSVLGGRNPTSDYKNNVAEKRIVYDIYHDTVSYVTAVIGSSGVIVHDNRRATSITLTNYGTTQVQIGNGGSSAVCSGIYCIRIYSRALTAAEIAHNYEIDKIRFNLP